MVLHPFCKCPQVFICGQLYRSQTLRQLNCKSITDVPQHFPQQSEESFASICSFSNIFSTWSWLLGHLQFLAGWNRSLFYEVYVFLAGERSCIFPTHTQNPPLYPPRCCRCLSRTSPPLPPSTPTCPVPNSSLEKGQCDRDVRCEVT